ncbi:hypothetical protein GCM10022218_07210 [Sphingobacterium ginsenosidimutans]|uniref:Knr4/Smi1-like domain-containing protein n=2 Tax=Sphingobacterium ginsenosidimutans TaxID=687845 RepID=A0ABP7ZT80_9SPHI
MGRRFYFTAELTILGTVKSRSMDYLNKIRKLFALEQDGIDGYSELEIQKLEEKINIVFPKTLRTYYQTLGANNNINYCYNRLLSPEDDVALLDGYLPIYEENQAVVTWGIKTTDLSLDNPPVYANYDTTYDSDWELEKTHVSDFLLMMAIYNGTFGGLRYYANCLHTIPSTMVAAVESNWELIPELSVDNQKIFTRDYTDVISLSFDGNGVCQGAFVGTMDPQLFDNILEVLDVDWSYISFEDEDEDED